MILRARVAVFPVYRDNPYVNLLTLAARARGYEILDSASLEGLERDASRLGQGDVLHVHWTSPIVQRAAAADEAEERSSRFRAAVDSAKARGARVVWTIHNVVPHDLRHDEVEFALDRFLADRADVVHTMTPDVPALTATYYPLDASKVIVLPHPSYQGVYPAPLSRADARASFDLGPDDRAVLFFGQMRTYKGLDALFEAMSTVAATLRGAGSGTALVLLLAGRTDPDDLAALEAGLPAGVRVIREHAHVPDADVARWFEAADVAVLPYRRILNSGTLHLAATFGLPVVLPDEEHLVHTFRTESWIRWFDRGAPADSLAGLLADPSTYKLPRDKARSFAARLSPFALSNDYADLLDRLTDA